MTWAEKVSTSQPVTYPNLKARFNINPLLLLSLLTQETLTKLPRSPRDPLVVAASFFGRSYHILLPTTSCIIAGQHSLNYPPLSYFATLKDLKEVLFMYLYSHHRRI